MKPALVAAFYKFTPLDDVVTMRAPVLQMCHAEGTVGTILLPREGANGTISGSGQGIANVRAYLHAGPRIGDFPNKESRAVRRPFNA
jgi:UPF0176 protein